MPMERADEATENAEEGAASVRCDFCGAQVPRVRRIALDGDYERLRTPHKVQYACDDCSKRKEKERRARAGS